MKYFNLFYISIIAIGIGLFMVVNPKDSSEVSFYGFAETNETEINFNYPVVVNQIKVAPGQFVKKGSPLLFVSRMSSNEKLVDEDFKIKELASEEQIWRKKLEGEIRIEKANNALILGEITTSINEAIAELAYRKELTKDLNTLEVDDAVYAPLNEKIATLKKEKELLLTKLNANITRLEEEKKGGSNPYRHQINLLNAEKTFNEESKIQPVDILAPTDGLVGNVHCKEAEHIPSYTTLISFYEPNPSIIKGYIHEDLTMRVNVQDSFIVRSIKNQNILYRGVVIGLGSRIVEIPTRLRKIPEIQSYGREVSIQIPIKNQFLQKEKVALELINGSNQSLDKTINKQ